MHFLLLLLLILCYGAQAQNTDQRLYILGNSTIDHRPPAISTPSDETTMPHWIYLLAQEANHTCAVGGQYGFLSNFDDLNWFSQWGYDIVPSVWESDMELLVDANVNSFMLTTANFIQYQPVDESYPLDESTTVLDATLAVFDHAASLQSGMNYYLFQNWPEMDLALAFPPTIPPQSEIDDFHNQTTGSFHDWWISYQDSLLERRPELNVRLIPVGYLISKLLRDEIPGLIAFDELYEDSAPHGRANIYFLAGLINYMALYGEKAPATFTVPTIIDPVIRTQYEDIVDFIWDELIEFNLPNGESRVFQSTLTSTADLVLASSHLSLHPNPTPGLFTISGELGDYAIDILDVSGNLYQQLSNTGTSVTVDINGLPVGLYFIRVRNLTNGNISIEKILRE